MTFTTRLPDSSLRFTSAIDILEDVLQASIPATFKAVLHAVTVSDFGQGDNPVRITSMRSLPDSDTDAFVNNSGDDEDDEVLREMTDSVSGNHVVSLLFIGLVRCHESCA